MQTQKSNESQTCVPAQMVAASPLALNSDIDAMRISPLLTSQSKCLIAKAKATGDVSVFSKGKIILQRRFVCVRASHKHLAHAGLFRPQLLRLPHPGRVRMFSASEIPFPSLLPPYRTQLAKHKWQDKIIPAIN